MLNNTVFTPKEAAGYLKINSQVLERYLREGIVPARKIGKQWRISKLALDLWLAPSLTQLLPQQLIWSEIFSIGDKIEKNVNLTDNEIIETITTLRKERGIKTKSRARH